MRKSSPKGERLAIVAVTERGKRTALRIKAFMRAGKLYIPEKLGKTKEGILFKDGLKNLTGKLFEEFDGIIFCMAVGIVVRSIAPCVTNKHTDPAVVVVDDEARFAVSLLSGHEGGANELAIQVGNILAAEPVITTASEVAKKLVVGIGCMRGVKKEEIIRALKCALSGAGYAIDNIRCIATIDLKRDEPGLKEACLELGIPLRIISTDTIKNFNGQYQRSEFVKEKIGVEGVSEPCALLAAKIPKLILPKEKVGRVTIAVVREC